MPPPHPTGFPCLVVAVGVEELENPVVVLDLEVRLHRDHLSLNAHNVGARATGHGLQLGPGRGGTELRAGAKACMGGRGVVQPAWSDSVFSPSARCPSGRAPTKK